MRREKTRRRLSFPSLHPHSLRVRFDERYPIEAPEVTFIVSVVCLFWGWNRAAHKNDDVFFNHPPPPPPLPIQPPAPVHPHVFSVGHICADILYTGSGGAYSPALTISKLCLAIRSMLASATVREPPADDEAYSARVRAAGGRSPKKTFWHFHDDKA